jgi:putative ABC transport system substrate-binding protein
MRRVGILVELRREEVSLGNPREYPAFWEAMAEYGWVEGRNVAFEWATADGRSERLPEVAAELVRRQVDVIVCPSPPVTTVARNATPAIPIVMMAGPTDPIAAGLAESFARPNGNVTGITGGPPEYLGGKSLEILKEAIPGLSRLGILWDTRAAGPWRLAGQEGVSRPGPGIDPRVRRSLEETARTLGVELHPLEVQTAEEIEGTLAAGRAAGVDGLWLVHGISPTILGSAPHILDLAARHRLPTISIWVQFRRAGVLVYSIANVHNYQRRGAWYVDQILRGARPGDLPIEQADRFDLVINLRTARALGLTIPQSMLARATEVIE